MHIQHVNFLYISDNVTSTMQKSSVYTEEEVIGSLNLKRDDIFETGWKCTVQFSSVQLLSHVRLFATPWTAVPQASLPITNSQNPLKLMSIELVMPSNHLILCRPLLLPPSILPSFKVFSKESFLHKRWPKYWSFSFSISSSNEYSGLVSFKMNQLDLLTVQGTLKSFLQYSSKAKPPIISKFSFVRER